MDLNQRRQLPLFSMGIVQKLTGLSARQIRYYHEQGLVQPSRSEGNQRLFSLNDVESLMLVRSLLDDGMTMEEVKTRFQRRKSATSLKEQKEPSDAEVYQWIQKELLESPSPNNVSQFQGDLFRLYRRNP